tara:strand:- start:415 stop:798 length:384 start_codon:yes stop_codon:yes gene_type:complete
MNDYGITNEKVIELEVERDYKELEYNVRVYSDTDEFLELNALREEWTNHDGKFDRRFGPAISYISADDGSVFRQEWYKDGKRHREDGPAVKYIDPITERVLDERFYLDGEEISQEKSNSAAPTLKLP